MSEWIRREDALDAIQKRADEVDSVYSAFWEGLKIAQDIVEKIPSAESECQEFEWCHDCKEYDQEKHCCHRWTKVIRNTVEEMKNQGQWIPVTEAFPEEEKDVLVTVHFDGYKNNTYAIPPCDYVEVASHIDGCWTSLSDEYKVCAGSCHHVLAWMSLPEPWRGDQ